MRSVNKVILIGNLTRDPIVKSTQNGQKIVTFTIATNREWVSQGERKSLAEFHHVAAWGHLAEICENFLKKGKLIYVEGYLKTRNWEIDGVRVSRTEIVAYDLIMLNKREDYEGGEEYEGQYIPDEEDMFGTDIPVMDEEIR